jgi:hypothetical protein
MKNYIPDLLLVAGAASVAYGAWLLHPAAGFVAGGAMCLIQAIKMAQV